MGDAFPDPTRVLLLERSGLAEAEFASRIGVTGADLSAFLDATVSPPASLMIRMRRLSDRFAKMRAQRAQDQAPDRTETNNSDGYFQSGPG